MIRRRKRKLDTTFYTLLRNFELGNSGLSRSSPGMVRAVLYTASETEKPVSSLGTERRQARPEVGKKPRWSQQQETLNCLINPGDSKLFNKPRRL